GGQWSHGGGGPRGQYLGQGGVDASSDGGGEGLGALGRVGGNGRGRSVRGRGAGYRARGLGGAVDAAGGEPGVGSGHCQRCDVFDAQGQRRQAGRQVGAGRDGGRAFLFGGGKVDAEALCGVGDGAQVELGLHGDVGDVDGVRGGLQDRHRSGLGALRVAWSVGLGPSQVLPARGEVGER